MKKIIKYSFIALLAVLFFMSSCDDEDYTGFSKLSPTSPTLSVSGAGESLTEAATTYKFNVTLSVAQIVDVALYVTQTAGDAVNGSDFQIVNSNSRVYIPANSTTGVLEILIIQDELPEATETFTLTIGDEKTTNASITPVDVTFSLVNYTEDELSIDLSWETDVLDVTGLDLHSDEAVDLRMLILDASDNSVVEVIDGGSYENYSGMDTLPDGDYLIAADVYSSIDAGEFDGILTIDLSLDFYQAGVINHQVVAFEEIMNDFYQCDQYYTVIATVTKAGGNYTIVEEGNNVIPDFSDLVGDWNGTDAITIFTTGEPQVVTTLLPSGEIEMTGLGFEWMTDFWGEIIIDGGSVVLEINYCDYSVNISEQYYMTTTYNGDEQTPYTIVGSGTVDVSGTYPTMQIMYEMNNGADWGAWTYNNGYGGVGAYFYADITLDPAGKSIIDVKTEKFDLSNKPY